VNAPPGFEDERTEMNKSVAKTGTTMMAMGAAANVLAQNDPAAKPVDELMAGLRSTNEVTNAAACDSAAEYGAGAVQPLALTMGSPDFELGRRCKRALYRIVRHAGRPGADTEATAVETNLLPLLSKDTLPVQVRRDLVWILSEIGSARAVEPLAALFADKDLRDDARCVLLRLPCPEAFAALKRAFATAPEDFKFALADSLRSRGEHIEGYPSKELIPTAQTTVTPLPPKK